MGRLITEPAIPKTAPAAGTRRTARQPVAYTSEVLKKLDRSDQKVQFGPNADEIAWLRLPKYLDNQFHETHPLGCHHSSLVSLACRSYILVTRSWSAYDSNHGSARLDTVAAREPSGLVA